VVYLTFVCMPWGMGYLEQASKSLYPTPHAHPIFFH
jgi:hypothetical protein